MRHLVEINDLVPFLENCLHSEILDYSMKFLTGLGENFGSTILAVTVKTNANNRSKTVELVIKAPVTNDVLATIFQPTESFKKENHFYTDIIPALMDLQRKYGFSKTEMSDFFIRCYGARLSLNPDSNVADSDALLILENLKTLGYRTGDRVLGFNRSKAIKVLERVAQFHALPIALRLLNRKVFEDRVRSYLKPIDLYVNYDSTYRITKSIRASIDKIEDLDVNLYSKVMKQLTICSKWRKDTNLQRDTPYTTIVHRDLWTNNIMFTTDSYGDLENIKILDFQLTGYYSFAMDFIFFLFTSVNIHDLSEHFEEFLIHYYRQFYRVLESFGCPLEEYTYKKIRGEVKSKAKYELEHIILMLKVILADKNKCPSINEINFDFILKDNHLNENFYDRLKEFLIKFNELGFL